MGSLCLTSADDYNNAVILWEFNVCTKDGDEWSMNINKFPSLKCSSCQTGIEPFSGGIKGPLFLCWAFFACTAKILLLEWALEC